MSGWLTNGVPLAVLPLTGNERFPLDTNLSAGAAPEQEAVSISQLGMGIAGSVPWVAGRFYGLPAGTTPTGGLLVTASTYYSYPLWIPQTTIKTVNIGVQLGQAGGNAHAILYADNGAGYPGNLVVDFGAVGALTATATVTLTLTTPQALNSGLYWVTTIFTATSTYPDIYGTSLTYTNVLPSQLGFDTAAHALATSSEETCGISVISATYGSTPTTFPTGGALSIAASVPLLVFGV